jgi:hypothetical protein
LYKVIFHVLRRDFSHYEKEILPSSKVGLYYQAIIFTLLNFVSSFLS